MAEPMPEEVVPYRPPLVYIQNACLLHTPTHLQDREGPKIFERPQRLRSVNVGVASLYTRLEEMMLDLSSVPGSSRASSANLPIQIVRSTAKVESFIDHPPAKYVMHVQKHEGLGGPTYAEKLQALCEESQAKIEAGEREIPDSWEQDLYLCPGTLEAIKGALGTVCQAVDAVAAASRGEVKFEDLDSSSLVGAIADPARPTKAFAAIRPPGELCVADTPAGRGLVNNVAVAAMHAFEQHAFRHIVIFDIDLFYGKGTHDFCTEVNRQAADVSREGNTLPCIFYGGLHDLSVYPCVGERIHRADGGQQGIIDDWFANVPLFVNEDGEDDEDFNLTYMRYSNVIWEAEEFLTSRGAEPKDVIVLMSCGFTASEHESTDLRRENYALPTDFYRRFTRNICEFADKYAQGRLVSVLAGGYSERALVSGVMAHLAGMLHPSSCVIDTRWWSTPNLEQCENGPSSDAPYWVRRAYQIASCLDEEYSPSGPFTVFHPPVNLLPGGVHPRMRSADEPTVPGPSIQSQGQPEANVTPLQWAPPFSPESLQSSPAPATRGKGKGRAATTPRADTRRSNRTASSSKVARGSGSTSGPLDATMSQDGATNQAPAPASRKRNAPNPKSCAQPKRARQASLQSPVSGSNVTATIPASVATVYSELKDSLGALVTLVDTHAAELPHELKVALRPIKGCVLRLADSLGEADSVREATASLHDFSQTWHKICKTLADRDVARRLNSGLYAFEGALLDLKDAMGLKQ